MPPDPVARLVELLTVVPDDDGRFRVDNPDRGFGRRVFGGQVAGQALRAAYATVADDRRVHSLHGYFLRPGRPGVPIVYEVDQIRDGASFTTRTVVARQPGEHADEAIFELSASFHVAESGADYQQPMAADVPSPEEAPEDWGFIPPDARDVVPMEIKDLGPAPVDERGFFPATRRVWMRLRDEVPDDRGLHEALLVFLSDMGAVMGARAPIPENPLDRLMGASLDHAMWFHRPIRPDRWFLYELRAVSNAGSRGLAVGTMHAADGTLGVSVAQEALLRVIDPDRRQASTPSLEDGPDA